MPKVVITIEDNDAEAVLAMSCDPKIHGGVELSYAQRIGLAFSAIVKLGCFEEIEDLVNQKINAIRVEEPEDVPDDESRSARELSAKRRRS